MNTYHSRVQELHTMLTRFMENGPFTGLQVGIVSEDEVLLQENMAALMCLQVSLWSAVLFFTRHLSPRPS